MPKIINYPRSSFEKCLEIAEAADSLGGTCDVETCAEVMNRKVSGGFRTIIASAQKYNLINYEKGSISLTENYKLIKHAYSEKEKNERLIDSFLSPDVFRELFERFLGKKLPVDMLEKILIREFDVEEREASRISNYFVDGLTDLELLDDGFNVVSKKSEEEKVLSIFKREEENNDKVEEEIIDSTNQIVAEPPIRNDSYVIQVLGPGLNTRIEIEDEDDLVILEATL